MPEELLLVGPRELTLSAYDESPLQPRELRAEAIVSGISLGTELATYRGTSPHHERRFDLDLRLFVDEPGDPAYPTRLGYEWVGVVRDVGGDVDGYRVGDLVQVPRPHRRTQTCAVGAVHEGVAPLVLPDGLEPDRAILVESASIALQAVHDARIKPGDRVAVFGLGVLGLLAVQLARRGGAGRLDAIDPVAARRDLAAALGADATFDPTAVDVARELKSSGPGRGADVAIEFSGRYEALHEALRAVRLGGTVVAAGFYQGGGGALRLGEEFHHNRLTLVSSMRGWGAPHRDHPAWDRHRLRSTALDLIASGALASDDLVSHRITFVRAAEAYELLDREPDAALRIALTY
jgi:2-desacetyl-2-hydroxyethyl bacteriochlorophyllide A dehydrogenase